MATIAATSFDYSKLEPDVAGKLKNLSGRIIGEKRKHADTIVKIGETLATAQGLMASRGEGQFVKWLDLECGFSKTTAYRYISAYREFGDFPNVGKIEPSAMYELASNVRAKKAAMRLADKGENVTNKVAKSLTKKHSENGKSSGGGGDSSTETDAFTETEQEVVAEVEEPYKPKSSDATHDPDNPCPHCGCVWWDKDDDGWFCDRCKHPFGEPVGDVDEQEPETPPVNTEEEKRTAKNKAKKTAEALLRALDDLHELKPNRNRHGQTMKAVKTILDHLEKW